MATSPRPDNIRDMTDEELQDYIRSLKEPPPPSLAVGPPQDDTAKQARLRAAEAELNRRIDNHQAVKAVRAQEDAGQLPKGSGDTAQSTIDNGGNADDISAALELQVAEAPDWIKRYFADFTEPENRGNARRDRVPKSGQKDSFTSADTILEAYNNVMAKVNPDLIISKDDPNWTADLWVKLEQWGNTQGFQDAIDEELNNVGIGLPREQVTHTYTTIRDRQITLSPEVKKTLTDAGFTENEIKVWINTAARTNTTHAGVAGPGGGDNYAWQIGIALDRVLPKPKGVATADGEALKQGKYTGPSRGESYTKWKQNFDRYGNAALAFLAVVDPALVDRYVLNDKKWVSEQDFSRASQILQQAGWDQIEALGLDPGSLQRLGGLDGSGGSGAQGPPAATLPDPAAIAEDATNLWRKWFKRDPTQSELDNLVGGLNALARTAQANANDNQESISVSPEAQIRQAAKGTADYGRLFGKMPTGMTEEEYVQQFDNAATSMLGGEAANPEAVRRGMESGDYQTTVGVIAGDQGSRDNSTFMERLARAARIINMET